MSTNCILYTGTIGSNGYGQTSFYGKTVKAHRIAWMQEYGPIPDGLWVLHSCDNPPCINLEHLRLGTAQDNSNDMILRSRSRGSDLDRCSEGHVLGKSNAYRDQDGVIQCRFCAIAERKRQLPVIRMRILRDALCI